MEGVDQFHWNLARSLLGITCVFAASGVVFNSIIFLTTLRTRSLRATYNLLIAVCALADVFHLLGTLVQLPLLFGFYVEIESYICDFILFIPEMGIAIGCMCILCVGLDRMLSVLLSTRYRVFNKFHYHIILGTLIAVYCCYLAFLMIAFFEHRRVFCQIMAPYAGFGYTLFGLSHLVVNSISIAVYFITWLKLRSTNSRVTRRIIKTLIIVVAVDVGGWFATPGLFQIAPYLNLDGQQMFVWIYFSIIFINAALSAKLFIYYFTSGEYRSALRAFVLGEKIVKNVTAISKATVF